ncbi:hypothetical protein DFH09DRAFT_968732 [Mycena vulgaris]|nr:hypothetical protein DFH09DRAFT_968732 [Mycena vulgaris]
MGPLIEYLHLLPVEVWLACWSLCSLPQLRRISLVCQLFRSIALSFLFRDQSFDVAALVDRLSRDNWMDRVRHLHRTAVRLDRLVEDPYAPFVRSWKVTLIYRPDIENIHLFDTLYDRVLATFTTTLGVYQNLSSLDLRSLIIDSPIRSALLSLPKLEDLTLRDCNLVARIGFLDLEKLTISGFRSPSGKGPCQLASPASIRTLSFDLRDYTGGLLPTLFSGFGPGTLPRLVHISIHITHAGDIDTLFRFLERCPRLESLVITSSDGKFTPPAVQPTTIPRLHTLGGSPKLIELLTPGRPVTAVTVFPYKSEDESNDVCIGISRSTSPIHTISLPCMAANLKLLATLTQLFPDLRELTIELEGHFPFRRSCMKNRSVSAPTSVDTRPLELCDDDAFDDPPAEDISDTESDEHERHTVTPSTEYIAPEISQTGSYAGVHHILRWIFSHQFMLPPNIEVLRLKEQGHCNVHQLTLAEQRQAIAALGHLYPSLREVQFGVPSQNWKKMGELWRGDAYQTEGRAPGYVPPPRRLEVF